MSSLLDKVFNAFFSFFDKLVRGICLSICSSFSKSFWNAYVNVSTLCWFSFGVHVCLCDTLNCPSSRFCSVLLKYVCNFIFLMNALMSFRNCVCFIPIRCLAKVQIFIKKFQFRNCKRFFWYIYYIVHWICVILYCALQRFSDTFNGCIVFSIKWITACDFNFVRPLFSTEATCKYFWFSWW